MLTARQQPVAYESQVKPTTRSPTPSKATRIVRWVNHPAADALLWTITPMLVREPFFTCCSAGCHSSLVLGAPQLRDFLRHPIELSRRHARIFERQHKLGEHSLLNP
jgi:hypothetical protein